MPNDLENLYQEIKELIIDCLNLEDITPEDIETEAPLFNDGLGLDSIDALELGLAIKAKYQVTINAEDENLRSHFYSVKTLADFVQANLP